MLQNIKNNGFLLNFIASNMNLGVAKKQEILETSDYMAKAHLVMNVMNGELQLLQIKERINQKFEAISKSSKKNIS